MPRGRKPKVKEEAVVEPKLTPAYYEKELAQREQEHEVQLKALYNDLAQIKHWLDLSLRQIGFMDGVENVAEAAFRAGRAYAPLDEANDKIEEMLTTLYEHEDFNFDHWDDLSDNF
jgi:hypothetical protein